MNYNEEYIRINVSFQEAYKRLDKLCKDYFSSANGVSEYIRQMETVPWSSYRYVSAWEYDYKMLKHIRWIRNRLAHEEGAFEEDVCSYDDLKYVEEFYNRIMRGSDPFTVMRKEKEAAEQKEKEYRKKQAENCSSDSSDNNAEEKNNNQKSFLGKLWAKIKSIFS